jgi:hypothetical protein
MLLSSNIITWKPVEGTTTSGEVTLSVSDGELVATETFTVTVSNATGIQNIETKSITLYPNPVRDVLTLQSTGTIEHIQLITVNGTTVLSEFLNDTEKLLDVQHLEAGMYLLQLKMGNDIIKKIICKE